MPLDVLRYDKTTFDTSPLWREIRTGGELLPDDVKAFLAGEAAGPAVFVLEESVFERVMVAASLEKGEALIQDLGFQNLTASSGQTTSLRQEFKSALGTAGLRSRYVQGGRVPGAIGSFLSGLLEAGAGSRHFYFLGTSLDVWNYLAATAGDRTVENPIWSRLRQMHRGSSAVSEQIRQEAFYAAQSRLPILILGETGTGKGLIAKCIHLASARRDGPFIAINCAVLAPSAEAVLFGYEPGAFTDAIRAMAGVFERASGGTLFLDEIAAIPLEHQAKFLKVLEDGVVQRMGSTKAIPVDVKLVIATNENLPAMMASGTFRTDLYPRLAGRTIKLPPLREHRADIPDLVEGFWPGAVSRGRLSEAVLEILVQHDWPHNIRQLGNIVERLREDVRGGHEPSRDKLLGILADYAAAIECAGPVRTLRTPGPTVRGSVRERLDAYEDERPRYERLQHVLRTVVERIVHDKAPLAVVRSHTATRAELAERLHRAERGAAFDRFEAWPGRCEVQVMVYVPEQKRDVYFELKHYLDLRGDTHPRGGEDLGAVRQHPWTYTVCIDEEGTQALERVLGVSVPADVLGLTATLELRTVLEDLTLAVREQVAAAGAEMPRWWQATLIELSGILNGVQDRLGPIHRQLASWAGSYGTYVSDAEARSQLADHEKTLAMASDVKVAAWAGKLAIVLGEWKRAIRILQPFEYAKNARVLRDLGAALCKEHKPGTAEYQQGLAYLDEACRLAPLDPDAFARLAGALRRMGEIESARCAYETALAVDPANPYALSGFIHTCLMLDQSSDVIARTKDAIEKAVGRCRERVAASVDMPWALLDLGKFLLLSSGHVREGLEAYAKAIGRTTAPWMLKTTMRSLFELGKFSSVPRDFQIVQRMLAIGWCARFRTDEATRRLASLMPARRDVKGPVVLLVEGGDGPSSDDDATALVQMLSAGLAGFDGTVMVVGRVGWAVPLLAKAVAGVRVIDYPQPSGNGVEARTGASPPALALSLDPWADAVMSGVSAASVVMIMLGTHPRITPDRELALSLGARVAIVPIDDDAEPTWEEDEDGAVRTIRDAGALTTLMSELAKQGLTAA